jgi:hypothetical protein
MTFNGGLAVSYPAVCSQFAEVGGEINNFRKTLQMIFS